MPLKAGVEIVPEGVNETVEFVPVAVTVCVWPESALPANVGCVKLPAAIVGTPAGHETVGCVKLPAAIAGTPAGHATVPPGVIEETPPAGFAVVAVKESPEVGARAEPPVAVLVIMCVPVVAAVVPP